MPRIATAAIDGTSPGELLPYRLVPLRQDRKKYAIWYACTARIRTTISRISRHPTGPFCVGAGQERLIRLPAWRGSGACACRLSAVVVDLQLRSAPIWQNLRKLHTLSTQYLAKSPADRIVCRKRADSCIHLNGKATNASLAQWLERETFKAQIRLPSQGCGFDPRVRLLFPCQDNLALLSRPGLLLFVL